MPLPPSHPDTGPQEEEEQFLTFDEWKNSSRETDPLEQLRRYSDYARTEYWKRDQLTTELDNRLANTVFEAGVERGILPSDPEEAREVWHDRPSGPTSPEDFRSLVSHYADTRNKEGEKALRNYVAALGMPDIRPDVMGHFQKQAEPFISNEAWNKSKRASALRGDVKFVAYDDEETGERTFEYSPDLDHPLTRDEIIEEFRRNPGMASMDDLPYIEASMKVHPGFNEPYYKVVRKSRLVTMLAGNEDEFIASRLSRAVENYTKGRNRLYEDLSFLGEEAKLFGEEVNAGELVEAAADLVKQRAVEQAEVDHEAPEEHVQSLSTGELVFPMDTLLDRDLFEKALDNLEVSGEERAHLIKTRPLKLAVYTPRLKELLVANDDFLPAFEEGKLEGKKTYEIIDEFFNANKDSYSGMRNRMGAGFISSIQGITQPVMGVPILFDNEDALRAAASVIEFENRRKTYARLHGDKFGIGYDIATLVPEMVTDVAIFAILAYATKGGSVPAQAVARLSFKAALKAYLKNRITAQSTKAILRRAISKKATKGAIAGALKGSFKSLFTARGFVGQTAIWGNRIASSAYVDLYTAMEGDLKADGTPRYTEHEIRKTSLNHALISGSLGGMITAGFMKVGLGGAEQLVNRFTGGVSNRTLHAFYRRMASHGRNIKDLAGQLEGREGALSASSLLSRVDLSSYSKFVSSLAKESVVSHLRVGGAQVLSEAAEEGLQEVFEGVSRNLHLNEDIDIIPLLSQAGYAAFLGGIFGTVGGVREVGIRADLTRVPTATRMSMEADFLEKVARDLDQTDSPLTARFVRSMAFRARARGESYMEILEKRLTEELEAEAEPEPEPEPGPARETAPPQVVPPGRERVAGLLPTVEPTYTESELEELQQIDEHLRHYQQEYDDIMQRAPEVDPKTGKPKGESDPEDLARLETIRHQVNRLRGIKEQILKRALPPDPKPPTTPEELVHRLRVVGYRAAKLSKRLWILRKKPFLTTEEQEEVRSINRAMFLLAREQEVLMSMGMPQVDPGTQTLGVPLLGPPVETEGQKTAKSLDPDSDTSKILGQLMRINKQYDKLRKIRKSRRTPAQQARFQKLGKQRQSLTNKLRKAMDKDLAPLPAPGKLVHTTIFGIRPLTRQGKPELREESERAQVYPLRNRLMELTERLEKLKESEDADPQQVSQLEDQIRDLRVQLEAARKPGISSSSDSVVSRFLKRRQKEPAREKVADPTAVIRQIQELKGDLETKRRALRKAVAQQAPDETIQSYAEALETISQRILHLEEQLHQFRLFKTGSTALDSMPEETRNEVLKEAEEMFEAEFAAEFGMEERKLNVLRIRIQEKFRALFGETLEPEEEAEEIGDLRQSYRAALRTARGAERNLYETALAELENRALKLRETGTLRASELDEGADQATVEMFGEVVLRRLNRDRSELILRRIEEIDNKVQQLKSKTGSSEILDLLRKEEAVWKSLREQSDLSDAQIQHMMESIDSMEELNRIFGELVKDKSRPFDKQLIELLQSERNRLHGYLDEPLVRFQQLEEVLFSKEERVSQVVQNDLVLTPESEATKVQWEEARAHWILARAIRLAEERGPVVELTLGDTRHPKQVVENRDVTRMSVEEILLAENDNDLVQSSPLFTLQQKELFDRVDRLVKSGEPSNWFPEGSDPEAREYTLKNAILNPPRELSPEETMGLLERVLTPEQRKVLIEQGRTVLTPETNHELIEFFLDHPEFGARSTSRAGAAGMPAMSDLDRVATEFGQAFRNWKDPRQTVHYPKGDDPDNPRGFASPGKARMAAIRLGLRQGDYELETMEIEVDRSKSEHVRERAVLQKKLRQARTRATSQREVQQIEGRLEELEQDLQEDTDRVGQVRETRYRIVSRPATTLAQERQAARELAEENARKAQEKQDLSEAEKMAHRWGALPVHWQGETNIPLIMVLRDRLKARQDAVNPELSESQRTEANTIAWQADKAIASALQERANLNRDQVNAVLDPIDKVRESSGLDSVYKRLAEEESRRFSEEGVDPDSVKDMDVLLARARLFNLEAVRRRLQKAELESVATGESVSTILEKQALADFRSISLHRELITLADLLLRSNVESDIKRRLIELGAGPIVGAAAIREGSATQEAVETQIRILEDQSKFYIEETEPEGMAPGTYGRRAEIINERIEILKRILDKREKLDRKLERIRKSTTRIHNLSRGGNFTKNDADVLRKLKRRKKTESVLNGIKELEDKKAGVEKRRVEVPREEARREKLRKQAHELEQELSEEQAALDLFDSENQEPFQSPDTQDDLRATVESLRKVKVPYVKKDGTTGTVSLGTIEGWVRLTETDETENLRAILPKLPSHDVNSGLPISYQGLGRIPEVDQNLFNSYVELGVVPTAEQLRNGELVDGMTSPFSNSTVYVSRFRVSLQIAIDRKSPVNRDAGSQTFGDIRFDGPSNTIQKNLHTAQVYWGRLTGIFQARMQVWRRIQDTSSLITQIKRAMARGRGLVGLIELQAMEDLGVVTPDMDPVEVDASMTKWRSDPGSLVKDLTRHLKALRNFHTDLTKRSVQYKEGTTYQRTRAAGEASRTIPAPFKEADFAYTTRDQEAISVHKSFGSRTIRIPVPFRFTPEGDIMGAFTNDPEITAHQLDLNLVVEIPDYYRENPDKINKSIKVGEDGFVSGALSPSEGRWVHEPGDLSESMGQVHGARDENIQQEVLDLITSLPRLDFEGGQAIMQLLGNPPLPQTSLEGMGIKGKVHGLAGDPKDLRNWFESAYMILFSGLDASSNADLAIHYGEESSRAEELAPQIRKLRPRILKEIEDVTSTHRVEGGHPVYNRALSSIYSRYCRNVLEFILAARINQNLETANISRNQTTNPGTKTLVSKFLDTILDEESKRAIIRATPQIAQAAFNRGVTLSAKQHVAEYGYQLLLEFRGLTAKGNPVGIPTRFYDPGSRKARLESFVSTASKTARVFHREATKSLSHDERLARINRKRGVPLYEETLSPDTVIEPAFGEETEGEAPPLEELGEEEQATLAEAKARIIQRQKEEQGDDEDTGETTDLDEIEAEDEWDELERFEEEEEELRNRTIPLARQAIRKGKVARLPEMKESGEAADVAREAVRRGTLQRPGLPTLRPEGLPQWPERKLSEVEGIVERVLQVASQRFPNLNLSEYNSGNIGALVSMLGEEAGLTGEDLASLLFTPEEIKNIRRQGFRPSVSSLAQKVVISPHRARLQQAEARSIKLDSKNPNTKTVLETIAENDPEYGWIAKLLLQIPGVVNTRIHVGNLPFSYWAGAYDTATGNIFVNLGSENGRGLTDVVIHELLHKATIEVVRNPTTAHEKALVAKLDQLRSEFLNQARRSGTGMNTQIEVALNDNEEFITYALTSPAFQRLLKKLRSQKKSFFSRLLEWFRQLFPYRGPKTDMLPEDVLVNLLDLVGANRSLAQGSRVHFILGPDNEGSLNRVWETLRTRLVGESDGPPVTDQLRDPVGFLRGLFPDPRVVVPDPDNPHLVRVDVRSGEIHVNPGRAAREIRGMTRGQAEARLKGEMDQALALYMAGTETFPAPASRPEFGEDFNPVPGEPDWDLLHESRTGFPPTDLDRGVAMVQSLKNGQRAMGEIVAPENEFEARELGLEDSGLSHFPVILPDGSHGMLVFRKGMEQRAQQAADLLRSVPGEPEAQAERLEKLSRLMGIDQTNQPRPVTQFFDVNGLERLARELMNEGVTESSLEFLFHHARDEGVIINSVLPYMKSVQRNLSDSARETGDLLTASRADVLALSIQSLEERAGLRPLSTGTDVENPASEVEALIETAVGNGDGSKVLFAIAIDSGTEGGKSWIGRMWNRLEEKFRDLPSDLKNLRDFRDGTLNRATQNLSTFNKSFHKLVRRALREGIDIPPEDIRILAGTTAPTIPEAARREIDSRFTEHMARIKAEAEAEAEQHPDIQNYQGAVRFNKKAKIYEKLVEEKSKVAVRDRENALSSARIANNSQIRSQQEQAARRLRARGLGELVDSIETYRNEISRLSVQLSEDESIPEEVRIVIRDNWDVYLTRTFRFFTTPEWKRAMLDKRSKIVTINGARYDFEKLKEEAARDIVGGIQNSRIAKGEDPLSPEEAMKQARKQLARFLAHVAQSTENPVRRANALRQNTRNFLKKEHMSPALRALLGEVGHEDLPAGVTIDDTFENMVRTHMILAKFASNEVFLKRLRDQLLESGVGKTKFEPGLVNAVGGLEAGNPARRALEGPDSKVRLWVPPEIAKALAAEFSTVLQGPMSNTEETMSTLARVVFRAAGVSLGMKTLGSFGFYTRNTLSNHFFFLPLQGIPFIGTRNKEAIMTSLQTFLHMGDAEAQAHIGRMVELQVLGDELRARMIKDLYEGFSATPEQTLEALVHTLLTGKETNNKISSKIRNILNKGMEGGATLNNLLDGMAKMMAFNFEFDVLTKAAEAGKVEGLTADPATDPEGFKAQLEELAAAKVKRTMQGHSQVWQIIKRFNQSQASLLAFPFARFKSDVLRILTTTPVLIKEELSSGNPVLVRRGMQRAVGYGLTTTMMMGALTMAFRFLFESVLPTILGMDKEDEEEDKGKGFEIASGRYGDFVRAALPRWQRLHTVFVNAKKSTLSVIDLTYVNPFALFLDPLILSWDAVVNARDPGRAVEDVMSYTMHDLLGEQIFFGAAVRTLQHKDSRGNELITKSDPPLTKARILLGNFIKEAYEPGILSKGRDVSRDLASRGRAVEGDRVFRAERIIAGELSGSRILEYDIENLMFRAFRSEAEELRQARSRTGVLKSSRFLEAKDIQEVIDARVRGDVYHSRKVRGYAETLMEHGMPRDKVVKAMNDAGFSKQNIELILQGVVHRWQPSRKQLEDYIQRADQKGAEGSDARLDNLINAIERYGPLVPLD